MRRVASVFVMVGVALLALTSVAQVPVGWAPLGKVTVDKNGCASCPATFPTPQRHRAFGIDSDSPFAVGLNGRFDVTCADGNTYDVPLRSATRGGLFQVLPNQCVNLDVKEIKLTITSVSLSPPDAERTITLNFYGRVR